MIFFLQTIPAGTAAMILDHVKQSASWVTVFFIFLLHDILQDFTCAHASKKNHFINIHYAYFGILLAFIMTFLGSFEHLFLMTFFY